MLGNLGAADEQAWYIGKKIASFTNIGLQNVDKNKVADVQYPFIGKTFTDEIFNELQGNLYAMDNFLYFLAEAQRGGTEDNSLIIEMSFFELPYVDMVIIDGNENIKNKDITEAITAKTGSFLQEQAIDLSKQAIVALYQKKGYAEASVESDYSVDETTNKASITYTITENVQKRIGEIVFEGVEAFSPELLKKQLESKAITYFNSGYYNPLTIETDKEKILSYYSSNGYIEAVITEVRTEDITEEGDKFTRLRIIYSVEEGKQWFFGGITIEGNTVFTNEEFQNLITMKKGSVLDQNLVQNQISKVADLYWNNGYIFNLMSTEEVRDEENRSISFTLKVQENQQAVIEDIRLEGTTKTKDHVFLRELTFAKGDIFSKEQLIKSAQNIYNTLIVTDVQFDILNGTEEGTVIPVFTVVEGNQMDIQFGATFGGNVDGFPVSGFLQWSDKNLGGTGRDLAISTTLSPDTQNVSVSFSDGWVGDRRWSNGLTLSFERSVKDSVLQRGIGSTYKGQGTLHTAYPLGFASYASYIASNTAPASSDLMTYDYLRFAVGYNSGYTFMFRPGALILSGGVSIGLNRAIYDLNIYDPFEKLIQQYGKSWQFSNRISLGLTWDGRDRIENTSKGYLLSQNFSYAGGILGGLSNYIRSSTSASGYLTLFSYTLAEKQANVVLGATSTFNVMLPQYYLSNDVWDWRAAKEGATQYEMLYIDGMNIGRGFPVETDKSLLFDNQLSISWPLAHNVLSAEIYTSATGVIESLGDFSSLNSLDWYYSMGAGIKLKIPGFPLGLYLVKNATYIGNTFAWSEHNTLFQSNSVPNSGLSLVLAITTSFY